VKTNNYLFALLSGVLLINATPLLAETKPVTASASAATNQTSTPSNAATSAIQAQVSRSAFTSNMMNREPVDQLSTAQTGQVINYFSELRGLQGHVITHRWEHNGQFKLGMQFPVNGQRWRVHSSKTLHSNTAGTWTVSVVNDDGSVLKKDTLTVTRGTGTGVGTNNTTDKAKSPEKPKLTTTQPNLTKTVRNDQPETKTTTPQEQPTKQSETTPTKPVKPLMPDLPEVQPPTLSAPAKPVDTKPASTPKKQEPTPEAQPQATQNTEEKPATNQDRKPIWEVLPQ